MMLGVVGGRPGRGDDGDVIGNTARASVDVDASPEEVWDALTDPAKIADWMSGSKVETDWRVGSPITWQGEYDGRAYEDKGEVLVFVEPTTLSVTHYSPMMGQPDEPESYHTLVYTLSENGGGTHVELTQDGCEDEEQAEQFSANWQQMLDGLKAAAER
jgi:uncharacterized protein YndB with AHSA1/START domain